MALLKTADKIISVIISCKQDYESLTVQMHQFQTEGQKSAEALPKGSDVSWKSVSTAVSQERSHSSHLRRRNCRNSPAFEETQNVQASRSMSKEVSFMTSSSKISHENFSSQTPFSSFFNYSSWKKPRRERGRRLDASEIPRRTISPLSRKEWAPDPNNIKNFTNWNWWLRSSHTHICTGAGGLPTWFLTEYQIRIGVDLPTRGLLCILKAMKGSKERHTWNGKKKMNKRGKRQGAAALMSHGNSERRQTRRGNAHSCTESFATWHKRGRETTHVIQTSWSRNPWHSETPLGCL